MGGADRPGRGWNVAHIARRTTTDGHARWDVRWQALGVWQAKTFRRRQDADAFRRSIEAGELRGVVVDVRQTSERFGEFATEWLATRRRPDGRPLALGTQACTPTCSAATSCRRSGRPSWWPSVRPRYAAGMAPPPTARRRCKRPRPTGCCVPSSTLRCATGSWPPIRATSDLMSLSASLRRHVVRLRRPDG